MATTPNTGEDPIRPDQSDVVQTDLPDLTVPKEQKDDQPEDDGENWTIGLQLQRLHFSRRATYKSWRARYIIRC